MKAIESIFGLKVRDSYTIRPLVEEDMTQMHRTFGESFSDYAIPYNLTLDEFTMKMKHKVHISFRHSYGAFSNQKLIAFVFHAVNRYENLLMAYNRGTGVLPGHQGNHLTASLYAEILPELSSDGIERCVLEVLETNERAIHVYEHIGFRRTKRFTCFQLKDPEKLRSASYKVVSVPDANLDRYCDLGKCGTSFGDTNDQLRHNIQFETTLEVRINEELAGYLIFQPSLGRITQFCVSENFRRSGIGRTLFTKAKSLSKRTLTVININREYMEVIAFLKSVGFVNTLDQFEMQLAVG